MKSQNGEKELWKDYKVESSEAFQNSENDLIDSKSGY